MTQPYTFTMLRGIAAHLMQRTEAVILAQPIESMLAIDRDRLMRILKRRIHVVPTDTILEGVLRMGPGGGVLPFYTNLVQVVSFPISRSRGNSPANPVAFKKLLKQAILEADRTAKTLTIILVVNRFEYAVPHIATVARCFPMYWAKNQRTASYTDVRIECHFADESRLARVTQSDWAALNRLANSIRATAFVVDAPPSALDVETLVLIAISDANRTGIQPTVIKGDRLKDYGLNGLYNVGKAAKEEPVFVCLSHKSQGAKKSFALVGQGIMFDTGGLQMKSKDAMPGGKSHMAGAAAALEAFNTLVAAGFTQDLHVLLCCAENAVSAAATKPDNIITLHSGKTVEINNTDAAGRLVLADGVSYAKNELKASTIIDIGTLTCTQNYVSGRYHAAIMSNNEELEKKAIRAGLASGDLCHAMQFVPDLHMGDFASDVADMKNAQLGEMMAAPSELAGLFIGAQIDFGEDGTEWLHVDMDTLAMDDSELATAYGVPLLVSLLAEHTNAPILGGGRD